MLQSECDGIRKLIRHEDLEFVKQGLVLWEALFDDFSSFQASLHQMAVKFKHLVFDIEGIFDINRQRSFFYGFHNGDYISLWVLGVLSSFEEMEEKKKAFRSLNISSSFGRFISLPENFRNLVYLERINLSANFFEHFPLELLALPNVRALNLADNRIPSLPQNIGDLELLQVLDLSDNLIAKLPKSFEKLTQIKILDICGNPFGCCPPEILQLKSLQRLNLSFVGLQELPESISGFKDLQVLDLHGNELDSLPRSFQALNALEFIDLEDNDYQLFEQEIHYPPNIQDTQILDFYNEWGFGSFES